MSTDRSINGNDYIRLMPQDNVVVALRNMNKGESIAPTGNEIILKNDVKRGHKIAICKISTGEDVVKYSFPIGHATVDIAEGEWVHVHNTKTNLAGIKEYSYGKTGTGITIKDNGIVFKGYKRSNGKTGIRNELWVVPTVGCVNGIGESIVKEFMQQVNPVGIDSVQVFKHNYGCSQLGDDHENTRKILGNIVKHPNAGGVLVLGLGCENNYVSAFKDSLGEYDQDRVKFLVSQEVQDEIADGVELLKTLYTAMLGDSRTDVPISELKVGLKCGGSDGLSGITANPLLGAFSDFLVENGGTTVLTEVPEMFGAETLLMNRAKDDRVFEDIVSMINDFKNYFMKYDQPIYENPSPGNKDGGITTLEDKSLGCTQKGGTAEVMDVLKYGDTLRTPGLNLLSAPGNDLVASTALGAAGCQLILFTTGRGTPFGNFVPTAKISTNSELYAKKPNWIDFNAGVLVEGVSMDILLAEFVEFVIEMASGRLVNNEKNNYRDIAIFKTGVTL